MTYKSLKSKIGMFFAGAYLLVIGLAIILILLSPPDGLTVLVLLFLTMPWSFIFFDTLADIAPPLPIVGFALFALCVFLNATILYFLGLSFSVVGKWINIQNEAVQQTPQDQKTQL
jgi:hypothetical protein